MKPDAIEEQVQANVEEEQEAQLKEKHHKDKAKCPICIRKRAERQKKKEARLAKEEAARKLEQEQKEAENRDATEPKRNSSFYLNNESLAKPKQIERGNKKISSYIGQLNNPSQQSL